METALAPDELLTEIAVPALLEGTGWGFQEAARRQGDFALVAVAVLMRPGWLRAGLDARVVVTGTGDGPARMRSAEAVLAERGADGDACEAAGNAAAEACDAADDPHAPAWYRQKTRGGANPPCLP